LHAFHNDVQGYPGPFQQTITAANRDAAITCLQDISQAVFAKDMEDNFMHRGWLQRWRQIIPQYIDWQIGRAESWQVTATETAREKAYRGLMLKGRIDRIDRSSDGAGIVDYKTGTTPQQDAVLNGEEVQLPFYALLTNDAVHQVEYLSLDANRFGSRTVLQGDELQAIVEKNGERLHTLMTELAMGAALPAWGDELTCRYCAMAGICRRSAWTDAAPAAPVE
jgi:ATP-dependent helicase/nuclease subunit B